jgi:Tfp pilus assembly protein PilO
MIINRLTGREQKIFAVCVILGVIYLGFNFIYKPMTGGKNILQQKIEKAQKKFIKGQHVLAEAKAVTDIYNQYVGELKQTEGNEQTESRLISDIEKEASLVGLTISDLKPKPVKQEKNFNYFSVSLSMEGPWTDILKLIHALQSRPYIYKVEEMNLDRASQRNSTSVRASFVLGKAYIP